MSSSEAFDSPLALVHGKAFNELPKDLYIPPDALEIILETFEGPLDLLLYLIRRQNLDILEIDGALQKLEALDQRKAELVRLRFFAGLTLSEAAQALRISASTADNDWAYAKTWLKVELAETA